MDGNGRWAKARRHSRIYGHVRGAKVAKSVIEESARLKVPYLTLFAFSTENWFRPMDEVGFLMLLLERQLRREQRTLMKNNIGSIISAISTASPIAFMMSCWKRLR
jgi:undecaprenyl diphosphate synthase